MGRLIEIAAAEWLELYRLVQMTGRLPQPTLYDNSFGHIQWMGRDAVKRAERKYWAWQVGDQKVAFTSSYFVSPRVIRLRVFYTLPAHRGKGHMKSLFAAVVDLYRNEAERIICFCGEKEMPVYLKLGFVKDERFFPRHPEYWDMQKRQWGEDPEELFLLQRPL